MNGWEAGGIARRKTKIVLCNQKERRLSSIRVKQKQWKRDERLDVECLSAP